MEERKKLIKEIMEADEKDGLYQQITAISWLYIKICTTPDNELDQNISVLFSKAKQMHKQEIKDAYNQGYRDGEIDAPSSHNEVDISEYTDAESYYNKTFNK